MNKLTKDISTYIIKKVIENNFEDFTLDINEILNEFDFLKDEAIRTDIQQELKAVLNENLIRMNCYEDYSTIHCVYSDIDMYLNQYNCTMTLNQMNNLVRYSIKKFLGINNYKCDIFNDIELNINNRYYCYRLTEHCSLKLYFTILKDAENYEDIVVSKRHKFTYRNGEFDSNFTETSIKIIKRLILDHIKEYEFFK